MGETLAPLQAANREGAENAPVGNLLNLPARRRGGQSNHHSQRRAFNPTHSTPRTPKSPLIALRLIQLIHHPDLRLMHPLNNHLGDALSSPDRIW